MLLLSIEKFNYNKLLSSDAWVESLINLNYNNTI